MVEDNIRMQNRATEMNCEQIFEEMKELEEKKPEEALPTVHDIYCLWRYQNERDEARKLQRSGSSRRIKEEADSQDLLSFQSCRSSAVDHVEEMSLEPPRRIQDVQVVISETAGKATRGRGEDALRLEAEGETVTLETKVVSNGVEGVHADPNGEGRRETPEGKAKRQEKKVKKLRALNGK